MIGFAVRALMPWALGFAGLGIGVLAVGGTSPWLWAFAYVAVAAGYVACFAPLLVRR